MKTKYLFVFMAILLSLTESVAVEIGGISYNLNSSSEVKTATVASKGIGGYFGDIVIPESVTYKGATYSVTSIDKEAFFLCDFLTSVTIPNSLISIEKQAFAGCTALKEVRITDLKSWCEINFEDSANPLSFAHHLFLNGEEIKDLVIPDGVTEIKKNAFLGASDFVTVSIANSVVTVGKEAFSGCSGLTSIIIPNSVTSIGDNAFAGCSGLTSIIIPNSVTSIGDNAFAGCSGLTSIIIPNSVTSIGFWAFDKCSGLTSISISNSIETLQSWTFADCSSLTSIVIPNSVINIQGGVFQNCSSLATVIIGSSVVNLGTNTFAACSNLKDIYFLGNTAPKEDHCFYGLEKNVVLHVKDYAIESFKGCEPWMNFKDIVCEKETDFILTYYINGGVYKTEKHKYEDDITPETDPTRKGMTFSGWDIEIPEKMPGKDVEVKGTFSWSKNTVDNVIYEVSDTTNNYCKAIGNESASGAIKIAEAVDFDFSYNVTTITDNTFNGCKDITSIEIPATVTTIGERAFANIDKLTDITIYAEEVPETDRTAFENSYIEDYVTLHVPAKALEKYKEAAPWKNFKEIVAIDEPEPVKYTLTYKVDGEIYETFELLEGDEIEALDEPTKEGYTFSGWDDVPEKMPGEDVTVSGTFTINKYLLIYMVDDEIYQKYEIEYGKEITAEKEPVKEGYVFSGWSEIPETMPAKDIVVNGTFKEDTAKGGEESGDTEDVDTGEEVIKISDAGQTTWCSKYDLDFTDFEDVKVYIASGYDRETGVILLTRVKKVPAGEGVYIIADKGDYNIPYKKINAYYANLMKGTIEAITLKETDGEYTNYYLSNGTQGVGFYKVNGSVDLKANRAYLPLLKNEVSSSRGFIGLDFDDGEDGTTGIRNTLQATEKDVWYNLQGQRVNNPGKGLYIRNGKKVFVR